ncbi:hypothetical protein BV20DRAFT_964936 [Pilatotrama ljubarskyi]|nr:hypothetical protein BV20DRAFT_964936 [Pilatotrama ljubarskyi]
MAPSCTVYGRLTVLVCSSNSLRGKRIAQRRRSGSYAPRPRIRTARRGWRYRRAIFWAENALSTSMRGPGARRARRDGGAGLLHAPVSTRKTHVPVKLTRVLFFQFNVRWPCEEGLHERDGVPSEARLDLKHPALCNHQKTQAPGWILNLLSAALRSACGAPYTDALYRTRARASGFPPSTVMSLRRLQWPPSPT